MYMFVMLAYVSLSPARYEIFAGLVDCDAGLGEAAHFGKTFGYSHGFFLKEDRHQYGFVENSVADCRFMKSSYDIL